MKRHLALLAMITLSLCSFASKTAKAQMEQTEQNYLMFGIGFFDFLGGDEAMDLRAEYRPGQDILINNLRPWYGIEVTTDKTILAGGGLLYDINLKDRWYVTPSVGAELYSRGNSNKDLDFPIEFRTQVEVSYKYDNGIRLGADLSHISNAGLDDQNPGTEVLNLSFAHPF